MGIFLEETGDPLLERLYVANYGSREILVIDLKVEDDNDPNTQNKIITQTGSRVIEPTSGPPPFPVGVFHHQELDHLYVSSLDDSTIYVFSDASTIDSGDIINPIQVISGNSTRLRFPFGLVIDTTR